MITMKASELIDRIIQEENTNPNALAKAMGLSRSQAIYDLMSGKIKKISSDYAQRIVSAYPKYNLEWLLTGEGEMLKDGSTNRENGVIVNKELKGIRYHDNLDASAGNVEMFDDEKENNGPVMRIPGFEDCTDALNVWGDSMYPVLKSGEIVILREWKESFIDYGKIYLVVTRNGNRMIKYLKPSEKDGMIKCVSENPKHPAFDVPLDSIHKVFLVKGHIEKCAI